MTSDAEKLFAEREKRMADAVALKTPDRVPIAVSFYFFPARHYGCTIEEMMYNPEKVGELHMKTLLEFQPDQVQNPYGQTFIGPVLDALEYKQMQWPGRQLEPDVPYQFVEGEYMKAEEYDHFFSDPMDFLVHTYWPRISGALKGLDKLPSFESFTNYTNYRALGVFGLPEVQEALDALKKAGQEAARLTAYSQRFDERLNQEGFPSQGSGHAQAPFDVLGDTLRGTKGLMIDMYRRPDTVLKACEKILPVEIKRGIASAKRSRSRLVFIALHKGLDGFMSPEQFSRFYWPTLKELVLAIIKEDLIPMLFWEGNCTSRLDLIKDIPAGKAIYRFEATDMKKAKQILGDRICIRGNVPISILATGTPDQVRSCCKSLIDCAGKDGGFIMDSSTHLTDARPENVHAMFDFTKEYGVY